MALAPQSYVLSARGLTKSFGGIRALKDVSLSFLPGEVHALLGENGAGKSTLIKLFAGVYHPDEGQILIDGKPTLLEGPTEAREAGVSVIFQEPIAFPDLTVAENIFMGRHPVHRLFPRIDWKPLYAQADEVLRSVGARFDSRTKMATLSAAARQIVEIAKALSMQSRVVIMDEPTSSLSQHEVSELFTVIRKLREMGTLVIFVSHRLDEVFEICDRVSVLRDGAHVATEDVNGITRERMVHLMVGRDIDTLFPKTEAHVGDVALKVKGLSKAGVFQNIEFEVRHGEILGLAGLVGSKRTDVAEAIFGIKPADDGTIEVDGRSASIQSARDAMALGIAYVPEDRQTHGLIGDLSIAENMTLPLVRKFARWGWIKRGAERQHAEFWRKNVSISLASVNQRARELSGGNQQKVVLSKWLSTKPRILILDEPTRGIDVGTKAEVHRLMSKLVAEGLAIIMISSELPELIGMSDRVVVMREGRISGRFTRAESTQQSIMNAATADVRSISVVGTDTSVH
jgi:rhamnose transport system ATP-binding protein